MSGSRADGRDAEEAIDDLVARCILALEVEGRRGVDALCEAHPQLASVVRERLADLEAEGLLSCEPTSEPNEIGPYRVLESIGQGGMGTVYLAEQREPVTRRVAIKVIKPGMDSREVLARFALERQALAVMDHPSIAKIFDAGMTAHGRPYFAMEFVAGLPLTDYCDRHSLPTRERLELVMQVCDAVQHAHHKGVIHRDLKPSNILVTEQSGKPAAKIIDFGVAKATYADTHSPTLHTQLGRMLGTPEYMSPEQADRDALDVDSRTDVYSLGVVLFELLTGSLPFPSRRLRGSDLGEVRRILKEEVPPSPSTRVATRTPDSTQVSSLRRTDPGSLRRLLRGDLDWITLKALEKDRNRRYATPLDLAADLRKHLNHEPVTASPPSRWYGLTKFVRRNRVQVATGVLVFGALIGGLATSLVFWSKARHSQRLEIAARKRAETSFQHAREAVETMLAKVGGESLAHVPQMEKVRRELLEEALGLYQRFLEVRGDDPQARFDVARTYTRVGSIRFTLGDHDSASGAFASARRILDDLHGTEADVEALLEERAELSLRSGILSSKAGRFSEARERHASAATRFEELVRRRPSSVRFALRLAEIQAQLGSLMRGRDLAFATRAYRKAIDIARDLVDRTPSVTTAEVPLIRYLCGLAEMNLRDGRSGDSEQLLARAKKRCEVALARDDASSVPMRQAFARVYSSLINLHDRTARFEKSLVAAKEAERILQGLQRDFPHTPSYAEQLASVYTNIAFGDSHRGSMAKAREHAEKAVATWESLTSTYPWVPRYRVGLAATLVNIGRMAVNLASFGSKTSLANVEPRLRRAVRLLQSPGGQVGPDTTYVGHLGLAHSCLAAIAKSKNDLDTAESEFGLAEAAHAEALVQKPNSPELLFISANSDAQWGALLFEREKLDAARLVLLRSVRRLRHGWRIDPRRETARTTLRDALTWLGQVEVRRGAVDEAAKVAKELAQFPVPEWMARDSAAKLLRACAERASSKRVAQKHAQAGLAAAESALAYQKSQLDATSNSVWAFVAARTTETQAELLALLERAEARTVALESAFRLWRKAASGRKGSGTAGRRLRGAFARLRDALLEVRDHVKVASCARAYARSLPDSGRDQFEAARALAAAAQLVAEGGEVAERYRSAAIAKLQDAIERGWSNGSRLQDAVFDAVRQHVGFRDAVRKLGQR